jgi:biopolymer transport protein ExbD
LGTWLAAQLSKAMTKAKIALQYVLPAALAGGVVAFCLSLPSLPFRTGKQNAELQIVEFPHGQCLIAVIEPDGVYVGNDRISVDQFGTVFDTSYRKQKLDWAMVFGTPKSRYGDAVKVYSKLHEALGNRITLNTIPVRPGTRWKAIVSIDRWGWFPEEMPE